MSRPKGFYVMDFLKNRVLFKDEASANEMVRTCRHYCNLYSSISIKDVYDIYCSISKDANAVYYDEFTDYMLFKDQMADISYRCLAKDICYIVEFPHPYVIV